MKRPAIQGWCGTAMALLVVLLASPTRAGDVATAFAGGFGTLSVAGLESVDGVLTPRDEARYRRIFALQEDGHWQEAAGESRRDIAGQSPAHPDRGRRLPALHPAPHRTHRAADTGPARRHRNQDTAPTKRGHHPDPRPVDRVQSAAAWAAHSGNDDLSPGLPVAPTVAKT